MKPHNKRYCCWRIIWAGSMVDNVFSIFSASGGCFLQNFSLELNLWTTWLNSSTGLKSCRWRWFHSLTASGRMIAFCYSYHVWRASHRACGSSSIRYSAFRSGWMWFLIINKALYLKRISQRSYTSWGVETSWCIPWNDRLTLRSIAQVGKLWPSRARASNTLAAIVPTYVGPHIC